MLTEGNQLWAQRVLLSIGCVVMMVVKSVLRLMLVDGVKLNNGDDVLDNSES